MQPNDNLEPIAPEEALEKYLQHRENEGVSEKTIQAHRYRLQHFVGWCIDNAVDSLHHLSARDFQDFRHWRKQDGGLNNVTWHTQMTTLRVFVKWAESYEAIEHGLHEKIRIPKLDPNEDARDTKFSQERASAILEHLSEFEYASQQHTLFALLWHTGMRIGSARAIDLQDIHMDDQYVEIHHRPQSDTPLKNKANGERPISLALPEVELLRDYIDKRRPSVTDSYGRKPLFATENGRAHRNTMRNWVYKLARPCEYSGDCPHGRDIEECEAVRLNEQASKCPSSFSPHTIRRSSITQWLSEDVPSEAVSDRMNANEEAIDKHYDKRTEKGKMEQRKDYFL